MKEDYMEETKPNVKERHEEMAQYAFDHVEVEQYDPEFKARVDAVMREFGFADQLVAMEFMQNTGQIDPFSEEDRGLTSGGVSNSIQVRLDMMERFGCTKKTAMTHIKRAGFKHQFPGIEFAQWGGAREGSGRPKIGEDDVERAAHIAAMEALEE